MPNPEERPGNPLPPLIVILMLLILGSVILTHLRKEPQTTPPEDGIRLHQTAKEPLRRPQEKPKRGQARPDLQKLLHHAVSCWKNGDLAEAEDAFRTLLLFLPNNPTALYYLTLLSSSRGDIRTAEFLCRRFIQCDPANPVGYVWLSGLQSKAGKINEALASAKTAYAAAPESETAPFQLARIYAQAGEQGLTMHYLKLALKNRVRPPVMLLSDPVFDEIRFSEEFRKLEEETLQSTRPLKRESPK